MPSQRLSKSMAEKRQVIDWIEENCPSSPTRAASYFQNKGWRISPAQVRYWWKQREEIRAASANLLRLKGAGAKPQLNAIEDILFDLIMQRRTHKLKVSREWIQNTARELAGAEGYEKFAASDKWLSLFMGRYGLSLRRTTNLTTLTDDVLLSRAFTYMTFLSSHRSTLDPMRTVLMDETAVYFEDPRKKLNSIVIWKGKSGGSFLRIGKVYVTLQEKAWVNSGLLLKWLDLVFPAVFDTNPGNKAVVWDSMRAHVSKAVKQRCAEKKVQSIVIPGGMTPYLQAGDIGIYKSFKDNISPVIDAWKPSNEVQHTKQGNPKPPAVEVVARWVENAWQAVPDDVVIKSILGAGFADNFDDWHITRHDVYGARFREAWITYDESVNSVEEVASTHTDAEELPVDLIAEFDDVIVDE